MIQLVDEENLRPTFFADKGKSGGCPVPTGCTPVCSPKPEDAKPVRGLRVHPFHTDFKVGPDFLWGPELPGFPRVAELTAV